MTPLVEVTGGESGPKTAPMASDSAWSFSGVAHSIPVFAGSGGQAGGRSTQAGNKNKLFKEELLTAVDKESADPKVIAQFINAICTAVERESLSTDIEAFIPKQVSSEAVSKFLLADVHKRLKDKGLSLGDFAGGAQVKFIDKRMTVDLSDEALKELLSNYVRKDFRQLIFGK